MARAPFQVVVIPFRFIEGQREYAIFRRADDSVWQWIAGGGEDSESPIAAARREAAEEAGVPWNASFYRLKSVESVPVADFAARELWPINVCDPSVLLRM